MPGPITLTKEQLRERLELFREFGVSSYEEDGAGGVKLTLGPAVRTVEVDAPVLTVAEKQARQQAEMRRITLAHNPAAAAKHR
jgi:hypothetical protein